MCKLGSGPTSQDRPGRGHWGSLIPGQMRNSGAATGISTIGEGSSGEVYGFCILLGMLWQWWPSCGRPCLVQVNGYIAVTLSCIGKALVTPWWNIIHLLIRAWLLTSVPLWTSVPLLTGVPLWTGVPLLTAVPLWRVMQLWTRCHIFDILMHLSMIRGLHGVQIWWGRSWCHFSPLAELLQSGT